MAEKIGAEQGDKVAIHYTGKLESGEIFDSTRGARPYIFTIGDGTVLPAFEKKIIGMAIRESRTFCIPFEEAYGPLQGNMMIEILREHWPSGITPAVGMRLKVPLKFRKLPCSVKVLAVGDVSITVDANHPLAGKDLYYQVKMIRIKKRPSPQQPF